MTSATSSISSYISHRLDEVSNEKDVEISMAWAYVSAEMLGYDVEDLDFFPSRDCGIDFYTRSDRIFEIFQCKMHDLDDAGNLNLKSAFGLEGYQDLRRASQFLLGDMTQTNIDPRLLGLREQIREEIGLITNFDEEDVQNNTVSLSFRLITLGDNLSQVARDQGRLLSSEFRELEQKFPGIKLSLEHMGITSLSEFFQSPDKGVRSPEPISLRLAYDRLKFQKPSEAAINTSNFVTFYAPAVDLVRAAQKEGVALFDANVRYELSSSNINDEIRISASHPKTMRLFHLYNNGVTITSRGWSYKNNRTTIQVRDPAVINGCQTVRSLARVRKELESDDEGKHKLSAFDETCLVLVRLINKETVDPEGIVRAANTQNAMEPRNLLANRPEQRMLEKELQEFGWFLERKDGALDALKESKRTSFGTSISVFQTRRGSKGPKVIKSCDNRELARRWLSFIGYSDEGKNKRKDHFPGDGKGLYTKIFRQTPRCHRAQILLDKTSETDCPMNDTRPPAAWMLYSYHLFEMIKFLLPIATRVRSRSRKEIVDAGKEPTLSNINERILGNEVTRISFALSMLDHVVLELAGFVIALSLADKWLSPGPVRQALQEGVIGEFHSSDSFSSTLTREGVLDLEEDIVRGDPALIAIRLGVQAVDSTLRQPEFLSSFRSSERKSRYVQSDQLLRAYAEKVIEYDKYLSTQGNFTKWWKGGSPIVSFQGVT